VAWNANGGVALGYAFAGIVCLLFAYPRPAHDTPAAPPTEQAAPAVSPITGQPVETLAN
jgi:hypothetical protein